MPSARALLVALLLTVVPATAQDGQGTAWHDPDAGTTTLAWTHEPRTLSHAVYRDGAEVARLPPGHTNWTDEAPGTVTQYRVDSLHLDGSVRSLEFVVYVAPVQETPDAPTLPPAFASPTGSDVQGTSGVNMCSWISVMRDEEPLFVRYQTNPACFPPDLPLLKWFDEGPLVDMVTFLD